MFLSWAVVAVAALRLTVAVGVGLAPAQTAAKAEHEVHCPAKNVVVRTAQLGDIPLVCEGAQRAITSLADQGLDATGQVTVQLVHELPAVVSHSAVGCFVRSANRVVVLVYSEFVKRESWFGLPADLEL